MDMKQFGKKALVPVVSAVVGGMIVIAAVKFSPAIRSKVNGDQDQGQYKERIYADIFKKQDSIRRHFDSLFDDDFIAQNDPFEEMKNMRKQMEKRMESFDGRGRKMSNPFDSWFSDKFGGGTINDIAKREDDNFVYYDIKVDDINSTSINTKVEQGYVTISGTTEKKSGSDGKDDSYSAQSVFKSSFNRTFPLPEDVDQNKMQMVTEKNKVILKFPKIKA